MLVLASSSPRRKLLLTQAGYTFSLVSIPVPEDLRPGEDPTAYTLRLAHEKAQAVFSTHPDAIVLGADTIVLCDGIVFGKPSGSADAARILQALSGRSHHVITGVCLISRAGVLSAAETTTVAMRTLTSEEIEAYIATGEPMDKAGAYAIQGQAARWIPRIHGCYFNVVGLPLSLVSTLVESMQSRLEAAALLSR